MSKVLISWMAKTHDFMRNEDGRMVVNPKGTHGEFYSKLFDYDEHYLLCSSLKEKDDINCSLFKILCNYLNNNYNQNIKETYLGVDDIISIQGIQNKLRPFLIKFKDMEVDVFISPGTPSMQTTWYLLTQEFPNLKLFQVRPPKVRARLKTKISREYVRVNIENTSNTYVVREESQKKATTQKDIYKSPSIKKLYDLASTIANPYKVTTLILGQTGTGKEWLANHIHKESPRKIKRFLAVNCASLNDELLQSTLFGHVVGAFSGAIKDVKGYFELTNNGTLFLDEIGDISKKLQQSLLRVLQEGVIYRLGDYEKKIKVDVRIIAATNKDLWEMVEDGTFRADLYYRLAIAEIQTIPFMELPLKERDAYFTFFKDKWKRKLKRRKIIKYSKEVKRFLDLHSFPGNFREVENLIERFYTYSSDDGLVTIDMVPNRIKFSEGSKFSLRIEDVKNAHYRKVYRMFKDNKTKMKEVLGIGSINTLNEKLKELKLKTQNNEIK